MDQQETEHEPKVLAETLKACESLGRTMRPGAAAAIFVVVAACGGHATPVTTIGGSGGARDGVAISTASGRPTLVTVRRAGDPSGAIAIELRPASDSNDDALHGALVGALISDRLTRAGLEGVELAVGITGHVRVRALAPALIGDGEAAGHVVAIIDAALSTPVRDDDRSLAALRGAVESFAARPVADEALSCAERCLDAHVRPRGVAMPPADSLAPIAEQARASLVHVASVVVGVVGSASAVDVVAKAWTAGPAYPAGGDRGETAGAPAAIASHVTVSGEETGGIVVVEGAPRSAIVDALASLSSPTSPLGPRLHAADGWSIRRIDGVARSSTEGGGCVVVEVVSSHDAPRDAVRPAPAHASLRAAVAMEIARQEIGLALDDARGSDGDAARMAIATGGDPRAVADRAAWWAWPSRATDTPDAHGSPRIDSSTLRLPAGAASVPGTKIDGATSLEAIAEGAAPTFAADLDRARLAWAKSEIELRTAVESGQGELWAVLGSPCGLRDEDAADAGITAIALHALVEEARVSSTHAGVEIEPWIASTEVGLIAHAAPRAGEDAVSLARRVGDALAAASLATFPTSERIAAARGGSLTELGTLASLAPAHSTALLFDRALVAQSPDHPSWFWPLGTLDAAAHVGDDAIELRLATLRSGPIRLAVLAPSSGAGSGSSDASPQIEAIAHAVERWVPRRPGESRTCTAFDTAPSERNPPDAFAGARSPAISAFTVTSDPGVAIAIPWSDAELAGAALSVPAIVELLRDPDGPVSIETHLAGATALHVRFVRGVSGGVLVVVVHARDERLDDVVLRLRTAMAKLRTGPVDAALLARSIASAARGARDRRLDPRARVLDLFKDATASTSPIDAASLAPLVGRLLDDSHATIVAGRLARSP